jgi:hypothetical protein
MTVQEAVEAVQFIPEDALDAKEKLMECDA